MLLNLEMDCELYSQTVWSSGLFASDFHYDENISIYESLRFLLGGYYICFLRGRDPVPWSGTTYIHHCITSIMIICRTYSGQQV